MQEPTRWPGGREGERRGRDRTCRVDDSTLLNKSLRAGSDPGRRAADSASAEARSDDADEFLLTGLRSFRVKNDFTRMEKIDPITDFEDLVVIVDDQHDRDLSVSAKILD
jgi:hypothetical protein